MGFEMICEKCGKRIRVAKGALKVKCPHCGRVQLAEREVDKT